MKTNYTAWVLMLTGFVLGTIATTFTSGCQQTAATPVVEANDDNTKSINSDSTADTKPTGDVKSTSSSKPVGGDQLAQADGVQFTSAVIASGDWPQWGGNSARNNVPNVTTSVPSDWDIGQLKDDKWMNSKNIKWVGVLGSQSYGNAVVADGRVYAGTNNGAGHLKRYPYTVDLGCLLCFGEKDGQLLWQHSSEKLPTGRVHDWELQGICCAPLIEDKRCWFVSSRGLVLCLDTEGYHDGEDDGPVTNELARLFDVASPADPDLPDEFAVAAKALAGGKLTKYIRNELARVDLPVPDELALQEAGPGKWTFTAMISDSERTVTIRKEGPKFAFYKTVTPADKLEADTIWSFDMMKTLGVSQHNMCSCSVTALGDILFVCTSNGVDESHLKIPAPGAPSFIAMDKNTGEVFWTDRSPGLNIHHGQWSSPTVAELGGVPQVLFGGGDGWLYSFRADKGKDGKPTLLWKFDTNPKTAKLILGGRGTRNDIIGTPVVYEGLVYVAVGQDPEHGEGIGHLWCIDPQRKLDGSDVSPQLAMKIEGEKRVPIEHRRIQAVIEEAGEVAVDNPDSAVVWHYSEVDQNGDSKINFEETMHRSCGTVVIKDDLLYVADFSGLFHCLNAKTGAVHWTYDMLAAAWGSPLIADGKVYIGDDDGDVCIFNLSKEKHDPIKEINMDNCVYSTPIVANGILYVSNRSYLFAIEEEKSGGE